MKNNLVINKFTLNTLTAFSGQTLNSILEIFRKGEPVAIAGLIQNLQPDSCNVFILLTPAGYDRAVKLQYLKYQLKKQGFFFQIVGLSGSLDKPAMLLPLRSNILCYLYTEAFRGVDSVLRIWLRWFFSTLPKGLSWRGPVMVFASAEPLLIDHFSLITDEREIAFLFRENEKSPWAVRKSGARAELVAEYTKHKRAFDLLGRRVPALLELVETETTATMTLEAIRERFLGNVVAAAVWGKQQVFVREALAHLRFCAEIYQLLVSKGGTQLAVVSAEEVGTLQADCGDLFDQPAAAQLEDALSKSIGQALPKIIQHGDFCVRNLLIAGGSRGRVLIDWEDLEERRWPLADYVLLRLSLKEVYADLFATELSAMERVPELLAGLTALESELMTLLNLNQEAFRAAELLSLACLCRQNVRKGRKQTAQSILHELLQRLPTEPVPQAHEGAA